MALPNGKYRTRAGSIVEISGEHSGITKVAFDWLEEESACFDCVVNPYPEEWIRGTHRLTWTCDHCGGGDALLYKEGMGFTINSLAVEAAGGFTSFLAYAEQRRLNSAMFAVAAVIMAAVAHPDELFAMLTLAWILAITVGLGMFAFHSRMKAPALFVLRLFLFMEVLSVTRRIVG